MVFLWYFYGISWDFYGISMVFLWYFMGFLWDFYGISMGFLWYFYGISMVFHCYGTTLYHCYGISWDIMGFRWAIPPWHCGPFSPRTARNAPCWPPQCADGTSRCGGAPCCGFRGAFRVFWGLPHFISGE